MVTFNYWDELMSECLYKVKNKRDIIIGWFPPKNSISLLYENERGGSDYEY